MAVPPVAKRIKWSFDPLPADEVERLRTLDQGGKEWLEVKETKGMLSTTKIAPATGFGYDSIPPFYYWELLSERVPKAVFTESELERMNIGTEREPHIRDLYCRHYDQQVVEGGILLHPDHHWIGGSPDGLVLAKKGTRAYEENYGNWPQPLAGCIEIKHATYKMRNETRDIPKYHMFQMQTMMEIAGLPWCDYVVYHEYNTALHRSVNWRNKDAPFVPPSKGLMCVWRVWRSRAFWSWIFPYVRHFMECLVHDVAPERKWRAPENERPKIRITTKLPETEVVRDPETGHLVKLSVATLTGRKRTRGNNPLPAANPLKKRRTVVGLGLCK